MLGGFCMEIEILRIYEKNGILRVETECQYGKDNLGLSLEAKYLDFDDIPKWKKEVKKLLENKYSKELAQEKEIMPEEKKKYASLDDLDKK
jgi:hypothetical protein